jgi:octaprenyl-diphosphate synthase
MDLTPLRTLVQADLEATDKLIDEAFASDIQLITNLGRHLVNSGGKRLRPLIVLLSAKAFDYSGEAQQILAAVIELIHTATLLHDDVIDTSDLRRGQSTANAIWGNASSILVGDFLYSRAFQMMVRTNNMPVLEALASATNIIAEGEILQLLNCKNPQATEADYLKIIHAKTGVLFAAAAQIGPLLCQRSPAEVQALVDYGTHVGIAFQLVDDALDYNTETAILGKNQGDDLAEGKPTLPLIYAYKHSKGEEKARIEHAIRTADSTELPAILATIKATGALNYTYTLANEHVLKASNSLNILPPSPARAALLSLAEFAVERRY